ncbi:MAG: deoxyguanosinetriphosphate triphosphohydrolase [Desulfamplus sp.]|nr:deoxyguanosinetriphosphate triphosphohydrolase [Desulfamplus sp.]
MNGVNSLNTQYNNLDYKKTSEHEASSICELYQEREKSFLSKHSCLSVNAGPRLKEESLCSIRTPFQLDRDRIVYSNAFRRLKHKTQVFLSPLGDHYRTRLTHTLEVSEIARNIARAMRLNEDLAEAIALGHDLGHTPFGHGGETALKEIFSRHFSHNTQSLRVVDKLEKRGDGLNLTYQVRDGILKHSKGFGEIMPSTPGNTAVTVEGKIVRIADIIAYLNHDLDDALRSKVITESEVPDICRRQLGRTHSERARTMMQDIINNSGYDGSYEDFDDYEDDIDSKDQVRSGNKNRKFILYMGESTYSAMMVLRQFLYNKVYRAPSVHQEFVKAKKVLIELYNHFMNNVDLLQLELEKMEMAPWDPLKNTLARSVCDIIASMTDRYALELYTRLFFPSPRV